MPQVDYTTEQTTDLNNTNVVFGLTLFQANGDHKIFDLDDEGNLINTGGGVIYDGTAEPIPSINLHDLFERLETGKYSFLAGVPLDGGYYRRRLVPEKRVQGFDGALARSKKYMGYSFESGYIVATIDVDPTPDHPRDELLEQLFEIIPDLKDCDRIITHSNSGGLYRADGTLARDKQGLHIIFPLKCASEAELRNYQKTVKDRGWLLGFQRFDLSSPNKDTGRAAALERGPIDFVTWQPVQPIFERSAELTKQAVAAGFYRNVPAPQFVPGSLKFIDLSKLTLTREETDRAESLRDTARRAAKGQIEQSQESFFIDKGLEPAKAKKLVREYGEAEQGGMISPDHLLYPVNGSPIKACDLTAEHDGLLLRSVLEPDYRNGSQTAKVFIGNAGKPFIVDLAHGTKKLYQVHEPVWLTAARNQWHRRRNFTPDLTVNDRYLPAIPDGDIAIKAPMGTGKTHQLAERIKRWEGGVVFIGSRNTLLLQTVERCNQSLPPHDRITHIHNDRNPELLRAPSGRVALCFDSLDKFTDPKWFTGKLIILDEDVSGIKHLAIGGTLEKSQKRRKIQRLFSHCLRVAGEVIALDGNQSDTVVKYLETLRGKRITRFEDTCQPTTLNVTLSISERDRDYSFVVSELVTAVEAGRKIGFTSDSQILCECLDLMLTDAGFNVLRIDAKKLSDNGFKKLVSQPNLGQWIVDQEFDAVLLSPSAESGIDITTAGYFDCGFSVYFGLLDTDQQCQHLRRFREITDWLIHCPARSICNEQRSFFTGTQRRDLLNAMALELRAVDFTDEEFSPALGSLHGNPHFELLAELKASRSFEQSHARDCLSEALKVAGHNVTTKPAIESIEAKACLKALKEQIRIAESIAIYEAEPMDIETARQIQQSFTASEYDRHRARRALLLERLPGITGTSLWSSTLVYELLFKDRQRLRRLENWYLLNNLDIETKRKRDRIVKSVEESGLTDIGDRLAKLRWFEKTGITSLEVDDDRLMQIYESAQSKKSKARILGLSPGRWEPRQWFNRILRDYLGVTGTAAGYESPEGDPVYQFIRARLAKKLADFSEKESPQTQSLQGFEDDFNDLNPCIPHSNTPETLTQSDFEPASEPKKVQNLSPVAKVVNGPWQGMMGTIAGMVQGLLEGQILAHIQIDGHGLKSIPIECLEGVPA